MGIGDLEREGAAPIAQYRRGGGCRACVGLAMALVFACISIRPAAADFTLHSLNESPPAAENAAAIPAPTINAGEHGAGSTGHMFVHDTPVSEAARKIVPTNLRISVDPSVSAVRISFVKNDQPWADVLSQSLSNSGLRMQVVGDTVLIERRSQAEAGTTAPSRPTPLTAAAPHALSEHIGPSVPISNVGSRDPASRPSTNIVEPFREVPVVALSVGPASQPVPDAALARAEAAAAAAPPGPDSPNHVWHVTAGLTLREQIRQWSAETNGEYVLEEPRHSDPPEPDWTLTASDTYKGDMLHALGWLKAGFWGDPQPFFVVSQNNHILLRTLGSRQ